MSYLTDHEFIFPEIEIQCRAGESWMFNICHTMVRLLCGARIYSDIWEHWFSRSTTCSKAAIKSMDSLRILQATVQCLGQYENIERQRFDISLLCPRQFYALSKVKSMPNPCQFYILFVPNPCQPPCQFFMFVPNQCQIPARRKYIMHILVGSLAIPSSIWNRPRKSLVYPQSVNKHNNIQL